MNMIAEARPPEVSVIMPAHNAEQFICESIDSVIAQTFTDWELIVVDDASGDRTVELLQQRYGTDSRVSVVVLEENGGAAVARNTAIQHAKGRFIAFLDCDDLWLPDKLSVQLDYMKRHQVPFTFTGYEKVTPGGELIGVVGVPESTSYTRMLKTSVVGCSTAMYDTSYFGKVYMPAIRMRQDFGLWLALLKRVDRAAGIQSVLVRYRVRPGSISSNKRNAAVFTWRIYREVEKLPLVRAWWFFANYAVRGYLRHRFPSLARRIGVLD